MIFEIFKKTDAYRSFIKDAESGAAHAYLFECADEYFLRDFIKIISAALFGAAPSSRTERLVLAEQYADFEIYPNATIPALGVDFAKQVAEKCHLKPLENSRKLIAISGAQDMTAAAQNKLLKILEEPPGQTIFLLGAASAERLLPTVKSRLKKVVFKGFTNGDITSFLQSKGISQDRAQAAAAISGGAAGIALMAAESQNFQAVTELCLEIASGKADLANAGCYSRQISQLGEQAALALSVLKAYFWDILLISLGKGKDIANKTHITHFEQGALTYARAALINAIESVSQAEENLRYNANLSMQAEKLVLEILKGKHKWQRL